METCGKPIKFIGKLSSGKMVSCVMPIGHKGACSEHAQPGDEHGAEFHAKTIISPQAPWPFPVRSSPDDQAKDEPDVPIDVAI